MATYEDAKTMEYTGFKLNLTDYEKGFLTAFYESYIHLENYKCSNGQWYEHLYNDDMEWVGVQIGKRMFDICIWFNTDKEEVEYPKDLIACVYECTKTKDDNWTTDTSTSWFITDYDTETE